MSDSWNESGKFLLHARRFAVVCFSHSDAGIGLLYYRGYTNCFLIGFMVTVRFWCVSILRRDPDFQYAAQYLWAGGAQCCAGYHNSRHHVRHCAEYLGSKLAGFGGLCVLVFGLLM